MNIKLKFTTVVVALLATVMGLGGTASAVAPYVEGGDIYRVRNLTKGTGFSDPVSADKCEQLQYRVRIHNPGPDEVLNGVTVQAGFPSAASTTNVSTVVIRANNANPSSTSDTATVNISTAQKVTYVPGSSELLDQNGSFIRSIGDVTAGSGVDIGNVGISVNEKRFVQFKANIDCPQQPEQPIYRCDALNIAVSEGRRVRITVFTTTAQNGAVFKNAVLDWGDNSTPVTDTNIVGKEHQYGQDGTYTITATAHFTVNGQDVTAGGPNCVKQVTFKGDKPPVVTPPATVTGKGPTQLVNSGAGSTIALFAAVAAAGAFAHRKWLNRRLLNEQ